MYPNVQNKRPAAPAVTAQALAPPSGNVIMATLGFSAVSSVRLSATARSMSTSECTGLAHWL
jgi:hypothetical protein